MKNLKITALLLLGIIVISCQSKPTNNNDTQESTTTEKPVAKLTKNKYGIKSGIVEYSTKAMGTEVNQTLYFDDYGAKEATETSMEMAGYKSNTLNINKGEYTYTLDMNTKTGTKHKIIPTGVDIDFNNLSKELEKEMNLQKMGKESFAGKECEKYTIDYKDMQMKGSFLVWKGIALKSDFNLSTMKTEMIANNIQENVNIPSSKFEIPANFKITEQ